MLNLDCQRLRKALQRATTDLLDLRVPAGHWEGRLCSSALSTATAISALSIAESQGKQGVFRPLVTSALDWLMPRQNADGGWGDTEISYSNISTTMLVRAALEMGGCGDHYYEQRRPAEQYVQQAGGIPALKARYGRDKTFAVPILTNAALAGQVPWKQVSPLPFEMACFPQAWYRFLQLPVVSYAIPALVAIGQARFHHRPPRNPITWITRRLAVSRSLRVLRRMQPQSGGYLEAIPLTSFVVMSLASIGNASHPVSQSGLQFLRDTQRDDGSWPIDTNLATWNTSLAINHLASAGFDARSLTCLPWLLNCQYHERHPFTGADPGGWGWSNLSGAVPDADDTPSALLAISHWRDDRNAEVTAAAQMGTQWLLSLQNRDGGWPTFCRGWGKLPFDRSGSDLTAHALRALDLWADVVPAGALQQARQRGLAYLEATQAEDGWWIPLWFGNQDHCREENPVYGTSKVLACYRDLGLIDTPAARRGLKWVS